MRTSGLAIAAIATTLAAASLALSPAALAQTPVEPALLLNEQAGGYTAEVVRDGQGRCNLNLYSGPTNLNALTFVDPASGPSMLIMVVPDDVAFDEPSDNVTFTVGHGASQASGSTDVIVQPPQGDGTRLLALIVPSHMKRTLIENDITATNEGGETALSHTVPQALRSQALASFDSCVESRG